MNDFDFDGGRQLPLVEDFYTIQGEGFHTGRAAYFIRLGGCDVGCPWCDAKYTWNARKFTPVDVEKVVARAVAHNAKSVVVTGGEPLIYPLGHLTGLLHDAGLEIFLETSGTHSLSGEFDWICLSPKRRQLPLDDVYRRAHELKVVIQSEDDFLWAEENASKVGGECLLFLQPEWSCFDKIIGPIVEYVKRNPKWRISIQTHKFMNIP